MLLRILFFSFLLPGCAVYQQLTRDKQSQYIDELDWPIGNLRATIAAQIPVAVKGVSSNGREITSRLFVPTNNGFKDGEDANQRFYVVYTVLGDRQPYDVQITVQRERRVLKDTDFVYVNAGPDARLAKSLAERLRRELTKRREDRNVVDDFRVY